MVKCHYTALPSSRVRYGWNAGKANAFMFDGSARLMDKADLKKAGFSKAYDNSKTPPKLITL